MSEESPDSGGSGFENGLVLVELLEYLGGLVFVIRGERMVHVNREMARLSGWTREEILSMSALDLVHPDDHELVIERISRPPRSDPPQPGPWRIRFVTKSGDVRMLSISGRNVTIDGQLTVIGFALDLTELERIQAALVQSEALFRALAETTPAAIFLHRGCEMIYVNPGTARVTGYAREELLEMDFWEVIYPEDRELVRQRGQARHRGELPPSPYKVRLLTKSGRTRWIEIIANSVTIDDKPAVLGIALDITARQFAEGALRESEELYRSLIETSPDAIIVADLGGQIVMSNQRTIDLFRASTQGALSGLDAWELVVPGERARGLEQARLTLEQGSIRRAEYNCLRRDGTSFVGEINASRIEGANGEARAFIAVIRDLTERKRAEETMLRVEKLESVGILAGGIAHDFNNIMTAILGNVGLARRALTSDPATAQARLDAAETALLDAKHLTQQLLTFSKGGEPITQAVDLQDLLRETTSLVLSGTPVGAALDLPPDLPAVEADVGQLSQVISNLVINAVQAMPDGGDIVIKARHRQFLEGEHPPLDAGRYVEFSVIDQGQGIELDQLGHVFDPYFTTKSGGSGLGLATCHSIVRRHGGAISVDSAPGAGACFTVVLPASERQSSPIIEPVITDTPRASGRVMVMDDEDVVRDVAVEMLREVGFDAEGVPDGHEAVLRYQLALEAGEPYDLVILDLTIPGGMGGREALRRLRDLDPEVRAIVSSGYSNDPIMSEHQLFGFKGVATKPYTFSELQDVVLAVLEGS